MKKSLKKVKKLDDKAFKKYCSKRTEQPVLDRIIKEYYEEDIYKLIDRKVDNLCSRIFKYINKYIKWMWIIVVT